MGPLADLLVLDFTTLLPGPMATLILAEAGATVIKIERPGGGDDMRAYAPRLGPESVNFALLNRGKRSIAIDLKDPGAVQRLTSLLRKADVLVEQFRPGVMDRLGLGYDAVKAINPGLIYCAITGYGQAGPRAQAAGHDLNYQAETGMLMLSAGADGTPVIPPALIADLAGGAYPAVINILLALAARAATGAGSRLDIAMTDQLFPLMYWAIGSGLVAGQWPRPGGELVTGGSPRYHIYRTEDDKFLAAAPLEQKFWENFCDAIGLAPALHDDRRDPQATIAAVAALIRTQPADEWRRRLAGKDVCSTIALSIADALADPHFRSRGLFAWDVTAGGARTTATPVPVAPAFRAAPGPAAAPALGEANAMLDDPA
jgi:alpha-methylacyl-CoA racemase